MIEQIIWYLLVVDSLAYAVLTFSARMHDKKAHHFWKGIPLHWGMAIWYLVLVGWVGSLLMRMGML